MPDDSGIELVTKPAKKPRQVRRAAGGQPAATAAIWPDAADHRPSGYRLRGQQGRLINALGESIVGGKYRPGGVLPREPELMKQYEVSRTSLREALKVLAAKGLIETRQKIGTQVRAKELWNIFDADVLAWQSVNGLGDDILRDLLEMRQLIEPATARFAAMRASLDDIRRIEAACQAMREGMSDHASYAKADVAFHMAVFAASKNQLLYRFAYIIANFLQISFRIQQQTLNEVDNRIEDDHEIHVEIFQAINLGDPGRAEAAMLRAVMNGKTSLLRARAGETLQPGDETETRRC